MGAFRSGIVTQQRSAPAGVDEACWLGTRAIDVAAPPRCGRVFLGPLARSSNTPDTRARARIGAETRLNASAALPHLIWDRSNGARLGPAMRRSDKGLVGRFDMNGRMLLGLAHGSQ
jgi:hypothetical protein